MGLGLFSAFTVDPIAQVCGQPVLTGSMLTRQNSGLGAERKDTEVGGVQPPA